MPPSNKQLLLEIMNFNNLTKKQASRPSYSEMLRKVKSDYPKEIFKQFQQTFKTAFDDALISEEKNPEKIALDAAVKFIHELEDKVNKTASAIEMGDPQFAGKYIAEIIKFLMRRISEEKRPQSTESLKKKIYYLNEYDMASKKMPASSAMGQSINLTKQLLVSHAPNYIRSVINSIVSNL